MNLNDPQYRMEEYFPQYEHEPTTSFREVLDVLASRARSTSAQGRAFEALVKAFIEMDGAQSRRFDKVWTWMDYPNRNGRPDTGIDLVARERNGGRLIAVQCKFYAPDSTISLEQVNKFLAAYSTTEFAGGVFVSTTAKWGKNAESALRNREDKPVVRWGPEVFEGSSIDWRNFDLVRPRALNRKTDKKVREYQRLALEDTVAGFAERDRGRLIMACGSGKTFTALRIAERMAGVGGSVLFLTPSISLLSQSLRDWANDSVVPLNQFAVCSDTSAGKPRDDDDDVSPFDLPLPASTDAATLANRYRDSQRDSAMSVVFSTYQSLDAVSEAQEMGLPEFDLIVCDEAHRTTGVNLAGKTESNFRRVHDNEFIAGDKRLYMTATPRIYGDAARRRAKDDDSFTTLASMDDERVYGPELHRLGFGKAIEMGILSDYKVLIFDVDLEKVGTDLDELLSESSSELSMDNGGRMVGCWNGLRKRGATDVDFGNDVRPAMRAVAFSNSIAQSEGFAEYFPRVIESCIAADAEEGGGPEDAQLRCEVRHVDGTQNAMARSNSLSWLKEEPPDGVCRILTNARCLTEGIDVPALDAIMFLYPRRSEIDVVQAVGRVMRKSEGKRFGYIILPIARSPGASPHDTVSQSAYRAVWQVINAIAAHDDRFEAKVNQLKLVADTEESGAGQPGGTDMGGNGGGSDGDSQTEQVELPFVFCGTPEFRDAILSMVVDKYSNPRYWEQWADRVREIAERHEARIQALVRTPGSGVHEAFNRFITGLRGNLNDGVSEDEAIGTLSQHLVSKPVFDALFEDYAFTDRNPISRAMQEMIDALNDCGLEKETEGLERFYRDVRIRAEGVTTAAGKQRIIAELYERFLTKALPETAKNLGIVYTPVEVVDYIIRSVEDVLNTDFSASLRDPGVHVIDPFAGTGTFMTRLIQSGLIGREDLRRKYRDEFHANEIMLLAYYIAAVNIEAAYHDATGDEDYAPFPNIVLTDTFQSYESSGPMDGTLFPSNNERIERQKNLDIRVFMGNPPWSAKNNRQYPNIDGRVKASYAHRSNTVKRSALYDPYAKAIRLASDRILNDEGGIVAFVTNGGFIDSNAFDGFRKVVTEEFDSIYCYNLRGNQRTSGESSKKEGGKIFGSGSRAGVGILLLVKRPAQQGRTKGAKVLYNDIGDLLSRGEKLDILRNSRLATTAWKIVEPDDHGDWIGQRSTTFASLHPLTDSYATSGDPAPIFARRTLGLLTSRDAWCYASSERKLRDNIRLSVASYNEQVKAFQAILPSGSVMQRTAEAKDFADKDPQRFHWDRENYRDLARGEYYAVNDDGFRVSTYRPFCKQHLYLDRNLNNSMRTFPEIYPNSNADNRGICVTGLRSNGPFHTLITDNIVEYCLTGVNSIYLPRWHYKELAVQTLEQNTESTAPRLERMSNINPQALAEFRRHCRDPYMSEDDLFYYVYGVLHSAQYRKIFANDLTKSEARIPVVADRTDFHAFAQAGRDLAELHINYEKVIPFPLKEVLSPRWNPRAQDAFRVTKMRYGGPVRNPDKTRIIYNADITLVGIPSKAHRYTLGSRSALDWLIERYQVRTHKKSGIVNDPNDWATEVGDPRYVVDLVKRVTTVSVRTVEIVEGLPELHL